MNKMRKAVIASNEVSELVSWELGGYKQKVLLDGKSKDAPVIIFLHGGPGSPFPFSEGCRGMFPDITERFIMVYWDQLGCGINNHPIDDHFACGHFVDMTVDLIQEVKKKFPDNAVNLFGVSWGSVLALKASCRVPELLHRVLVYGQVLRELSFNKEVYAELEQAKMSGRQKEKLAVIKAREEHTLDDFKQMAGWIRKYTQGYQAKDGGKLPFGSMLVSLLTSPDYSFRDLKAVMVNGYQKNKSLLQEIMVMDLWEDLERVTIPYLIMQGSCDIVTSTKTMKQFMENTKNPYVTMQLIEHNGHIPGATGMEQIIEKGFDFLTASGNE
ncbi:alpha/beta hydrolase [Anaerolentibacter hominis]|uniref:alpha/beta hydrolase n=1 Tax=Anaerolentibacter hominis TaxID=3079009 RepID=UPI0031B87F5B